MDIGKKIRFPRDIIITRLRPDAIIVSRRTKTIVLIELTIPWEDRIAEAHEIKSEKYQDLVHEITNNNWTVFFQAVEVGARGFPS